MDDSWYIDTPFKAWNICPHMLPWRHPLSRTGPKDVVTEISQSQVAKSSSLRILPFPSQLLQSWFPMIPETHGSVPVFRKWLVTKVALTKHKSDHISPLLYTSQGCLCFPLKIQTPSWCQLGPAWASLLTVTVRFPSDLCQGLQQAKGFPSLVSSLVLFPRCLATGYLSPPGIHHLRVTVLTAI